MDFIVGLGEESEEEDVEVMDDDIVSEEIGFEFWDD